VAEERKRKERDCFDFFPHGGQQIRLFLLTVALVIRSEAVCAGGDKYQIGTNFKIYW
jgi:hypothetical protein